MKLNILGITITTLYIFSFQNCLIAENYTLSTEGKQVSFISAPELGYVIKLSSSNKSFMDITGSPFRDAVYAHSFCKRDNSNIWIVENTESANTNNDTIKRLRKNPNIAYAAPMFTINSESVGVIPEVVVKFLPDTENEQIQALCDSMDFATIKPMEFTIQEYLLEVSGADAHAVFAAVEKLEKVPLVEWAWPNTIMKPKSCAQITGSEVSPVIERPLGIPEIDVNSPGVFPNDEYFPLQWYLHNTGQSGGTPGADIRAPEAWEITTGDPNVVVAICDFGIDPNHPDLISNLLPGYDFWDDDSEAYPSHDYWYEAHGTMCAGVVAAQGNNILGVTGVTWNCKLMPIRFDINGYRQMDEAGIANAFRWAASQGADILSNSWNWGNNPTPIIQSAVEDITQVGGIGRDGKGCVVFCSAGNNGSGLQYIEKYPEVISVGATDHNDNIWWYSNHGPELDIVAPSGGKSDEDWFATSGRDWLWTTDINGNPGYSLYHADYGLDPNILDYTLQGGTSGACPIVAGVAALILSVDPNLTNEEVKQILYRSAHDLGDPGWDQYYGWGRVDARAAVEMALSPHIYIDDDGPADFNNIQTGIDAANDGDTVLVAPGDYVITEPITFKGKAITVRSKAGPDVTTIRMSDSPSDPDRASVIIFENNETETSVLDGFTITGGQGCPWNPAPGYSFHAGGGIFCSASSPTITGCIISENHPFSQNQARPVGGGVLLANSSAVMTNCSIHKNTTNYAGGGMYIGRGSPTVIDCIIAQNTAYHDDGQAGGVYIGGSSCKAYLLRCTISGNFAPHAGGGIQVDREAQPTFVDCLISDNTSEHIGGILCSFSSETTLTNCVITRNVADRLCGGIASGHDGKAIVTNCTITDNEAGQHSGGVTSYDNSSITLKNCIVYGNIAPSGPEIGLDYSYYHTPTSMNISYCDIKGGLSAAHIGQGTTLTWEEGNIDADPLFADPNNGDYHLKSQAGRWNPNIQSWIVDDVTSPCIDAGDPNSPVGLEPLPNGDRVNMGTYGGTSQASLSLSTAVDNGVIIDQQLNITGQGYTVVRLYGSYYEMGYAHGALLADYIVMAVEETKELFGNLYTGMRVKMADSVWKPAEIEQELDGMADALAERYPAAGIDKLDLKVYNSIGDLRYACRSHTCWGRYVEAPIRTLSTRRLDFPTPISSLNHHVLFIYIPSDGSAKWINLGFPGLVTSAQGVNEYGTLVSLHNYESWGADISSGRMSRMIACRYALTYLPSSDLSMQLHDIFKELQKYEIMTGTFLNYYAPEGYGGVMTCNPNHNGPDFYNLRMPQEVWHHGEAMVTTNEWTNGTYTPSDEDFGVDLYYEDELPKTLESHWSLVDPVGLQEGLQRLSVAYRGKEDMTIWVDGRIDGIGRTPKIEYEWYELFGPHVDDYQNKQNDVSEFEELVGPLMSIAK